MGTKTEGDDFDGTDSQASKRAGKRHRQQQTADIRDSMSLRARL
jgi:hypothetical protein